MRRSWVSVAIWDAILIAIPLVIAAIMALNHSSQASIRLILVMAYLVEVLITLVPITIFGPTRNLPIHDDFAAAVARKRESLTKPYRFDPIVIGPAAALLLVLLSFAVVR